MQGKKWVQQRKQIDYFPIFIEEGTPGGFIDKSFKDNYRKAYKEWKDAESEWQKALIKFAFIENSKKQKK